MARDSGIGTLGVVAIAFGIGVASALVLDHHDHACSCGNRWSHLGAFNHGDEVAHRCSTCGTPQWRRMGER